MLDLKKLVTRLDLPRDLIFTSLSSADKDVAMRLVKKLGEMHLNHWCMYHENGLERNISGDDYTKSISAAISKCCIFIFLMSANSLVSPEVMNELIQISPAIKEGRAKVLPIFVDHTKNNDIPETVTDLLDMDPNSPEIIIRRYTESSSEKQLDSICEEVYQQYLTVIFESVEKKFCDQRDSQKFNELMSACIKNKCTARSISDDIKESAEILADSLKEMHVLSNEMQEYDLNTYSCMVIASNLLGNEDTIDSVKVYRPQSNGVKYFYYTPPGYETICQNAFAKVRAFIRKTKESRREVTSLIRREFTSRNKVETFFREFDDMTMKDFKEQYHIEDPEDVANFEAIFNTELAQSYFDYSDDADVFSIPDEFAAWICGDEERYSYNTMIEVSYEFIDFLKTFVDFLANAKDVNTVSRDLLKKRYDYLDKFKKLEEWQMGRLQKMKGSESKRLVNYLLDYTADTKYKRVKKFPRLANWMQFHLDKNGIPCDLSEETISEANANLVCVPILEDDRLKYCYSFALFVNNTEMSGAWYTTGQGIINDRLENTVNTYNVTKQSKEYDAMLDAFSYMLQINPHVKELLKQHDSVLLRQLKNYENRGKNK